MKDELIRDRIVVGLKDAKCSEKLQLDPNLTLEKAVTQARQKEAVHEQQSIVRSKVISESKIDSLKFKQRLGQNTQRKQIRDKPKTQNRVSQTVAVPAHSRKGKQNAEVAVLKDNGFDFVCRKNARGRRSRL